MRASKGSRTCGRSSWMPPCHSTESLRACWRTEADGGIVLGIVHAIPRETLERRLPLDTLAIASWQSVIHIFDGRCLAAYLGKHTVASAKLISSRKSPFALSETESLALFG